VITLTLSEVIGAIEGRPATDLGPASVCGVSTDSRTIRTGELFFAIPGERFDGHAFAAEALARGAAAAVIAAGREAAVRAAVQPRGANGLLPPLIAVDDTVTALGRLGAFHRRLLRCPVIAIVGSNGKTTTKAMVHHLLSERRQGRSSPKSFNNALGVPLTLLSAEATDEYLVVEIGTNAPGEVAQLAQLAQPDMVVLTGVGEEHLERLGDLDGVAAEECSILRLLRPGGFAAVNIDSPQVRPHLPVPGVTVTTFGWAEDADLRVSAARYDAPWLHFELNGRFGYRLRLPGRHNASNAAGAVAVARRIGLEHAELAARLESFVAPPMRNELLEVGGVTIINDAYNANPRSAVAAFESLAAMPARGRRIVVFGEMRELGPRSAELHREVAERLAETRVDHVFLVGPAGAWMRAALGEATLFRPAVECCDDVERCGERLAELLRGGDVVLLKGSRAVGLERLIEPLRRKIGTGRAAGAAAGSAA
jgi:UDP-N-acetylmuramoyl-tripeptide--D-alanyl-D-alanine ligase